MTKSGKAVVIFLTWALTGCAAVRNYQTATFSSLNIIPDTVTADVNFFEKGEDFQKKRRRELNGRYFYDKFLADELIKRMEKRGWKRASDKNAEYALNISLTDEESDSAGIVTYFKGIVYALYKTKDRTPVIMGGIANDSSDLHDLDFINEALPIIDKELQSKNAYQRHLWTCSDNRNEASRTECYMEEINPDFPSEYIEIKNMNYLKTRLVSEPNRFF